MKERIVTKNFVCSFVAMLSLALVMYTLMSTITEYVSSFGTTATIAGLVSGIYVVGGLFCGCHYFFIDSCDCYIYA